MTKQLEDELSRRERQIMDILLELGEATVEDVRSRLPDPPSYSAARAMLAKLERKRFARHRERDLRYVYEATVSPTSARRTAVSRLVKVFFGGSLARAVTGMVDMSAGQLSQDELDEIAEAIEKAQKKRRRSVQPETKGSRR